MGLALSPPVLNIILPIGLSFHTFQSLSYVIEVYHGRQGAEKNFITYATYVMFFPQLVAGPIERPQNLLHQFYERHQFDYSRVTSGLKRIAWGLFKKLVVADRLALYVNDVYGAPRDHNGLQLTIGTIFFAYQIYWDFSGYSDIAIGTARILGFNLMENFRTPYYAESISEFWKRWHISLSTWFRDYVYLPLGGNRVGFGRRCFNLALTFGISGLWHGANWTYVVWGLVNGFYLIAEIVTKDLRRRSYEALGIGDVIQIRHCVGVALTFLLTLAAWIVFRAQNLADAHYILTHLFLDWDFSAIKTAQFQLKHFPAAVAAILLLEAIQFLEPRVSLSAGLARLPTLVRWPAYAAITFGIVLFGVYRESQFIYFQF
jgi:D-alanyl-lipoteichoic acid acyltransferase DltB (MBOAT superfamily)